RSVRQEIARAPLPLRSPRARTRGCRDAAVGRRRYARHQPLWRAAAESPAACVADRRSFQPTRRSVPALFVAPAERLAVLEVGVRELRDAQLGCRDAGRWRHRRALWRHPDAALDLVDDVLELLTGPLL